MIFRYCYNWYWLFRSVTQKEINNIVNKNTVVFAKYRNNLFVFTVKAYFHSVPFSDTFFFLRRSSQIQSLKALSRKCPVELMWNASPGFFQLYTDFEKLKKKNRVFIWIPLVWTVQKRIPYRLWCWSRLISP